MDEKHVGETGIGRYVLIIELEEVEELGQQSQGSYEVSHHQG